MLSITDDLSAFTLAAGEPFVLDLRFHDTAGAVVPLTGRGFVLSFHDQDRATRAAIAGEIMTDGEGDHVRFARDGRLSESLFGWPLVAELAERYRHGRDVIAQGTLTILPSAGDVASLDGAGIAAHILRVTIRPGADGAAPVFTQERMPFGAPPVSPAPSLAALSLPATTWLVGAPVDLVVIGTTPGAALTATLPPGLTIGNGRIAGAPISAGLADIMLVETLAGADNSPRTTVIGIMVAAPVVLQALSLSGPLREGVASAGTVAGAATGSRLATALPGLTIDSAARTYIFDGTVAAGTAIALTETLAGATGSPRATMFVVVEPVAADAVLLPHAIGPVDLGTQVAIDLRPMAAEPYMVGARFRRATNTADFWFRMADAGDGFLFRIIDDDHYRLIRIADGRQSEIGGYEYRTFSPPLVAAPASAFLELRVATDGSAALYQDGSRVSVTIDAAFLDAIQPQRGYGVRFTVTIGPAMANVTAGSLAPPLAIRTAAIDPVSRRIDLAIAYVGSPDRYDYALDGSGWAAARTLSSDRAGQAVLRLPALAPGIAGNVAVELRQHNAPDIRTSVSVVV